MQRSHSISVSWSSFADLQVCHYRSSTKLTRLEYEVVTSEGRDNPCLIASGTDMLTTKTPLHVHVFTWFFDVKRGKLNQLLLKGIYCNENSQKPK